MEKEYGDTTKHLRIQGCSYIFYPLAELNWNDKHK